MTVLYYGVRLPCRGVLVGSNDPENTSEGGGAPLNVPVSQPF